MSTPSKLLPDDGIFDELAVNIAVSGMRSVKLTKAERLAAIRKLITMHATPMEMMSRVGVTWPVLKGYLDELGYEIVIDPHVTQQTVRLIMPKNRDTAKMLPPERPKHIRP